MIMLFDDKSECCGCTACAHVCSHQAITMKPDSLGFLYPSVDMERCVECGLCVQVCAFKKEYDKSLNLQMPFVYAVRHKNETELATSRSGAMFVALSDYVLQQGGVVYGVGYANHFRVVHKRAETKLQCIEFKGSKYVQSDLGGVFAEIKTLLNAGIRVLFSGTPCQTAGLNSFVGKKRRNLLILVDIVCHGVPAPYIWDDYLNYIEKKYKSTIVKVDFRDKSVGWSSHKESFVFSNRKKIIHAVYATLFMKCIMFRPSCGVCPYANTVRPSDITIADYWGWEKISSDFNKDDKGCSLVFLNTEKALVIWDMINKELNYIATDLNHCMQPNLQHPSSLSIHSDGFQQLYELKGFEAVLRKYGDVGCLFLLNRNMVRIKKRILRIWKSLF